MLQPYQGKSTEDLLKLVSPRAMGVARNPHSKNFTRFSLPRSRFLCEAMGTERSSNYVVHVNADVRRVFSATGRTSHPQCGVTR